MADRSEKIRNCSFFTADPNFLMVITNREALVYALKDRSTAPLCSLPDIQNIAFLPTCGDRAIVVRSDSIELRDLGQKSKPVLAECVLSAMRLTRCPEIAASDFRTDAVEVITEGWWLTTIAIRNNRLFVSGRVRILNSKPYDWALNGQSMSFATADGKLLVTAPPGNRSLAHRRSEPRIVADVTGLESVASPRRRGPRTSEPVVEIPPEAQTVVADAPLPAKRQRRGPSGAIEADAQPKEGPRRKKGSSVRLDDDAVVLMRPVAAHAGSSCAFSLCLQVTNEALRHIEWIGSTRLIAWSSRGEEPGRENVLVLIDLRRRTCKSLLGKLPGMTITDVVFSGDKKYACVIVSTWITIFFRLSQKPIQIGSFTWPSPAFVDFTDDNSFAVIVFEKGEIRRTSALSEANSNLRLFPLRKVDFKEPATSCCLRKSNLFVGLRDGHILSLNLTSTGKSDVHSIRHMKSPIAKLRRQENGSILVIDEKRNSLVLSGETFIPIMGVLKNPVICPQATLLARPNGKTYIKVFPIVGDFTPAFATAAQHCPVMRPPNLEIMPMSGEITTASECLRLGLPLLARVFTAVKAGKYLREQATLLLKIANASRGLAAQSIRYSLLLGDLESARSFLYATDSQDPDFDLAILKASLIGRTDGEESVELAAEKLIFLGFTGDAIDIALIVNRWELAVKKLLDADRLAEAALICRIQPASELKTSLLETIAHAMLKARLGAYAMILLAEAGRFDLICEQFRSAGNFYVSPRFTGRE
jgi:hypothetical protein